MAPTVPLYVTLFTTTISSTNHSQAALWIYSGTILLHIRSREVSVTNTVEDKNR